MRTILVTGAAGFIGYHFAQRLLAAGDQVIGVDNLNDYYSTKLKRDRLAQIDGKLPFHFEQLELAEARQVESLFQRFQFDRVVHLAAQAGVRYSIENPRAYIDANIVATTNILEGCRHQRVPHLVYASSSSVYGANETQPFSIHQNVDHPVSLYAATKKANELMAHTYSHLYRLPTTGLRFFTVYGPWGRPDMALFKFTKAILNGEPIDVYNHGRMKRDFTYVDDITQAMHAIMDHIAEPNPDWSGAQPDSASSKAPYRIYNIGNNRPTELSTFIEVIEKTLGQKTQKNYLDLQPGDVLETYADVDALKQAIGFQPSTPIELGIKNFIDWYREYHQT